MNTSDSSIPHFTRRDFMKKSALTAGALIILSQGTALAAGESGSGDPSSSYQVPCSGKCNGFNPDQPQVVYEEEALEFNDPARYFIKGTCNCDHPTFYPAWRKEMPPGVDEEPPTPGDKHGLVEHSADHHKLHN